MSRAADAESRLVADGLWSAEIGVIIGSDPVEIKCTALELDDEVAPLLDEIEQVVRGQISHLSELEKKIQDQLGYVSGKANYYREVTDQGHREHMIESLASGLEQYTELSREYEHERARFNDRLLGAKPAEDWLVANGLSNIDTIFVRTPDVFGVDFANEIIDMYLNSIMAYGYTDDYPKMFYVLSDFPVPVFGSAPAAFQTIKTFLGNGSYVAAIFGAHETGGPSLAIFTASAGFIIWFGKPLAQVARQASKDWLAEKLGVTEIEK